MRPMQSGQAIDNMTALCLRMINARLAEAASVAKAALVFAQSDTLDRALRTALDIEEPIRNAWTLLNAASLLRRMAEEGEGERGWLLKTLGGSVLPERDVPNACLGDCALST